MLFFHNAHLSFTILHEILGALSKNMSGKTKKLHLPLRMEKISAAVVTGLSPSGPQLVAGFM